MRSPGIIAAILKHAFAHHIKTIEVSAAGEAEWVNTIINGKGPAMQIGGEGCTPGYYNNEGKSNPILKYNAFYSGDCIKFWQILSEWRDAGDFAGLEFTYLADSEKHPIN